MNKLKRFFFATPRDLSMQTLSLNEIVIKMKKQDDLDCRLPEIFARKVSIIMEDELVIESNLVEANGD